MKKLLIVALSLVAMFAFIGCSGNQASTSGASQKTYTYPEGWKEITFDGITTCIPDEWQEDDSFDIDMGGMRFIGYMYPGYETSQTSLTLSWSTKIEGPVSNDKNAMVKALTDHLEKTNSSWETLTILDPYDSNGLVILPYSKISSNGVRNGLDFFYDGKHYSIEFRRNLEIDIQSPTSMMLVYTHPSKQ